MLLTRKCPQPVILSFGAPALLMIECWNRSQFIVVDPRRGIANYRVHLIEF